MLDKGTSVLVLETRLGGLRCLTEPATTFWKRRVRVLEGPHRGKTALLYDWILSPITDIGSH